MSAQLANVLAHPGSIEARKALARAWEAAGDPRGALVKALIEQAELERTNPAGKAVKAARVAARALMQQHGQALVGPVADLVEGYELVRGLVGKVKVRADKFPTIAPALFAAAPVQHLVVTGATGWAQLLASPYLAKLVSFTAHRLELTDAEAGEFASSPHTLNLRWIDLENNGIGRPGVDRLGAAPQLAKVVFLSLHGNPCDPTPQVVDIDGTRHVQRPPLAIELERAHGARPWLTGPARADDPWPPMPDSLAASR